MITNPETYRPFQVLHFWYSEKQKHNRLVYSFYDFGYIHDDIFVIINGVPVEYTECSAKSTPSSKWDDYRYLGTGTMASIKSASQLTAHDWKHGDEEFLRSCGISGGLR